MKAKEAMEYAIYAVSLLLYAIASLVLGFSPLLVGLVFLLLAMAVIKRGSALPFAALFAYAAAVGIAHVDFTPSNLLLFGFLSVLPFFICFRISSSKVGGIVPIEAASVLIPILFAIFLLLFGPGPLFSSEQALMPQWLLLFSLLLLLALLLSVPLLAELWGRIAAKTEQKPI